MNLLLSAISIGFGVFVAVSPASAARIWGSELLERVTPPQKVWLLRTWRAFGILLCVGGLLFTIDNIGFTDYER